MYVASPGMYIVPTQLISCQLHKHTDDVAKDILGLLHAWNTDYAYMLLNE